MDRSEPPAQASPSQRAAGYKAFFGRLALAHFLAYPMIYAAAAAALPLAIFAREQRLLQVSGQTQAEGTFQLWLMQQVHLNAEQAASFEVIIEPIAWMLLGLFVLTHATSLPWAIAAKRARQAPSEHATQAEVRARALWLWSSLAPTAVVVAAGLVGWVRIFLL